MTVVIDENNLVLEVHPKGTEGTHRFVTGEVVSIGILQREITLKTSKGEQRFPMERQEMTASIKDVAMVTAELNEAGSVIDPSPGREEVTRKSPSLGATPPADFSDCRRGPEPSAE